MTAKAVLRQADPPIVRLRPSEEEACAAVRTLLAWIGEDPDREGLRDTPQRVIEAYRDHFAGYQEDPRETLSRTFAEVEAYEDMVMLERVRFSSHCEHHLAPFIGHVTLAYVPDREVVGISKLARLVDIFARRLQIQERMTMQIARALQRHLEPKGVAIQVVSEHQCMSCRGVRKEGALLVTSHFTGLFRDDQRLQDRFLGAARGR